MAKDELHLTDENSAEKFSSAARIVEQAIIFAGKRYGLCSTCFSADIIQGIMAAMIGAGSADPDEIDKLVAAAKRDGAELAEKLDGLKTIIDLLNGVGDKAKPKHMH
jgi:hypothetical protein